MTDDGSIVARVQELMELEEASFLVDFQETVEKAWKNF